MITVEDQVRRFYSNLKFPGPYKQTDFEVYDQEILNPFLKPYDLAAKQSSRLLDVGCGSGFISNLLAYRHPDCTIDAVDFSDSVDYAKDFSTHLDLKNVNYIKQNFFDFVTPYKYDTIICNGVLHHMPNYQSAVFQIDHLLKPNGILVVGLYNPWGKLAKRLFAPNYINNILYQDQELVPFELTFLRKQVLSLFQNYELLDVHPSFGKRLVDFFNLFNYNNGGLSIYTFQKTLIL
jgi:2-polyprenyl-3-methyl-5-hydroxy-6-metoxy-1,4-benzoquinol methylase